MRIFACVDGFQFPRFSKRGSALVNSVVLTRCLSCFDIAARGFIERFRLRFDSFFLFSRQPEIYDQNR